MQTLTLTLTLTLPLTLTYFPAQGIALRFPRFIRTRDDKGPEDATNATQIAQMYNDQACTQSKATKSTVDDDDDW